MIIRLTPIAELRPGDLIDMVTDANRRPEAFGLVYAVAPSPHPGKVQVSMLVQHRSYPPVSQTHHLPGDYTVAARPLKGTIQ